MVQKMKVEITKLELQALNEVFKDTKVSLQSGYILTLFKQKIVKAYQEEQKNAKATKSTKE